MRKSRVSRLRVPAIVVVLLGVGLVAPAPAAVEQTTALVRVRAEGRFVELRSFDLTEHGEDGWYDVVAHPGDRARLRALGFEFRVVVPDLVAEFVEDRAREARDQLLNPDERMTYRTLAEYEADLKRLASEHPDVAQLIEFPHKTHEGRTVYGIEIAGEVATAAIDGRPTSAIMGLHHAREWPSGELSIMFAEELVREYVNGTQSYVELLDAVRVIVVPVVNPDGYVRSRETVSDWVAPLPGPVAASGELAYQRKNMRKNTQLPVEIAQGVDINRNYPYHWGDTQGASAANTAQDYFGPAPASEPETQNMLWLMRTNQIQTLITNHTYSDLVLRPWGDTARPTPDETQLKALADAMAAINGYTSQKGIDLYPTAGTTDDWFYGVTGGFGYTFEIGSAGYGFGNTTPMEGAGFHPHYGTHIPNFYARNRGAFLTLVRAARNTTLHTVLTGTAPRGTVLTLRKRVDTPLVRFSGSGLKYPEVIEDSMVVGGAGKFTWHVNPSPLAATVDAVNTGLQPPSALQAYEITAERPDGTTSTVRVVAKRGQSYSLSF